MPSQFSSHPVRLASVSITLIAMTATATILYRLHERIKTSITAKKDRYTTNSSQDADSVASCHPMAPTSIPEEILSNPSKWVISYERAVSVPISVASLRRPIQLSASNTTTPFLQRYLQKVHTSFSYLPQAYIMKYMISEPHIKESFTQDYLQSLSFEVGQVVNGVYKVSHHQKQAGSLNERIEMRLEAPPSFSGHRAEGCLVAAIESDGDDEIRFVNETWMWRNLKEPPTLLESTIGGFLHEEMAGWLVLKGLETVVSNKTQ